MFLEGPRTVLAPPRHLPSWRVAPVRGPVRPQYDSSTAGLRPQPPQPRATDACSVGQPSTPRNLRGALNLVLVSGAASPRRG